MIVPYAFDSTVKSCWVCAAAGAAVPVCVCVCGGGRRRRPGGGVVTHGSFSPQGSLRAAAHSFNCLHLRPCKLPNTDLGTALCLRAAPCATTPLSHPRAAGAPAAPRIGGRACRRSKSSSDKVLLLQCQVIHLSRARMRGGRGPAHCAGVLAEGRALPEWSFEGSPAPVCVFWVSEVELPEL